MQNPSQEIKASLGCGTLILIAIIVAIFSNGGTKRNMENLENRLERIEKKLDSILMEPDRATATPPSPANGDTKVEADPN
jgi:hypothetical protein